MKKIKQQILCLALPLAFSALPYSESSLESAEMGYNPTGNCTSGQCSLNDNNAQYPQCNQNGQCAQYPQCYHRGPYYGCHPRWEAGIEKNTQRCGSCQSNSTNRHRFLPDSDTSSYEYYNFYESQCCPQ